MSPDERYVLACALDDFADDQREAATDYEAQNLPDEAAALRAHADLADGLRRRYAEAAS